MKSIKPTKLGKILQNSAADSAGGSVVLRLKIASETYNRLSALGPDEFQAAQDFLAQALQRFLDRDSPGAGVRLPYPANPPKTETQLRRVRFSELADVVPPQPGVYEIHTLTGVPLKVDISGNLRKRMLQHRASRQSALKLVAGGQPGNPKDLSSKASILAKHLYYDTTLATEYDLTSEIGRRRFLEERCYFTLEETASRVEARELERLRERELPFRYLGVVQQR